MGRKESAGQTALFAFAVGKILTAVGKTPDARLDRETRQALLENGGRIQVAAGALLTELAAGDPVAAYLIGINVLGYGIFILERIQGSSDETQLIRRAWAGHLRDMTGTIALLAVDRRLWCRIATMIGLFLLCLGDLAQALGRRQQLANRAALFDLNAKLTFGAWAEAVSAILLLLDSLATTGDPGEDLFFLTGTS